MTQKSLIGQYAPNFSGNVILPDGSEDDNFEFNNYIQSHYAVLFFYALNFEQVCTTELIALQKRMKNFKAFNTKVVAVGVESNISNGLWRDMLIEKGKLDNIDFPMVSDIEKEIAESYGILIENAFPLRATFILDDEGIVRHQVINDLPVGRNIDEILRFLMAFQHFKVNDQLCPAGWIAGDPAIDLEDKHSQTYLSKFTENL